jgi:hypothetical protein
MGARLTSARALAGSVTYLTLWDGPWYVTDRIAYVVGRYCGLDTSGSAFYLAAWESDDPEVVRERLGRISTTAEKIVEILEN